jgi:murein DD-endopeptidase MepM/ murein hydrolase activator NlpD
MLTCIVLLCAPIVNSPRHEPEPIPQPGTIAEPESRVSVKLRHGDTLASVLRRIGIQPPSAHALIEEVRPFVNPRKFRPGDNVHVVLNHEDRTVRAMEFVVQDNLIHVKAGEGGWSAERRQIPSVRDTQVVRGTIKGNLYESGIGAGLSPQQILDLATIFEFDIDFFSDFRSGDVFSVMVEQVRYADGRIVPGRILAAQLEADNEVFDGFYFPGNDKSGSYFNSEGQALRRPFLRAPLSYARISSSFTRNRLHPIFRTVRPHLAIDYAAPAGTPVVAIGSGKIEYAGWRPGYGNVVDIRHSGNFTSRYAHFSRFAPRLRRGQTIDQGDLIGFVGQTGHATGPHLHFEFLRGGVKINFLGLRVPKNQHLAVEDLPRFNRLREARLAMLRGDKERMAGGVRPDF